MRYPDKMPNITSGQKALIQNHGDTIWFQICNVVTIGRWFRPDELVGQLPSIKSLSPVTQRNYIRVVLMAVLLDIEQRPDDYDGGVPLQKRGRRNIMAYSL
jgi:hypothetical protein